MERLSHEVWKGEQERNGLRNELIVVRRQVATESLVRVDEELWMETVDAHVRVGTVDDNMEVAAQRFFHRLQSEASDPQAFEALKARLRETVLAEEGVARNSMLGGGTQSVAAAAAAALALSPGRGWGIGPAAHADFLRTAERAGSTIEGGPAHEPSRSPAVKRHQPPDAVLSGLPQLRSPSKTTQRPAAAAAAGEVVLSPAVGRQPRFDTSSSTSSLSSDDDDDEVFDDDDGNVHEGGGTPDRGNEMLPVNALPSGFRPLEASLVTTLDGSTLLEF